MMTFWLSPWCIINLVIYEKQLKCAQGYSAVELISVQC